MLPYPSPYSTNTAAIAAAVKPQLPLSTLILSLFVAVAAGAAAAGSVVAGVVVAPPICPAPPAAGAGAPGICGDTFAAACAARDLKSARVWPVAGLFVVS